jgi:hypothetical protein
MKHLRISALGAIVAGLCIITLGLAGCGRPAETPVKKSEGEKLKSGMKEKEMPVPSAAPITEERTYYDFETSDLNGWEIPMWTLDKTDYVAKSAEFSEEVASHGKASMKVTTDFPGGLWSASLVEIQQYLDLSSYRVLRADIYLPKDAPIGLKVKLILTVGNNWKFVEMSRSVPLIPGEWVTITANIEPGSYDWKRVVPDEEFSEDVRKIAVRIESNRKPAYTGPIYIDNIRVGR